MKHISIEGTRRLITAFQPHENKIYVQQDSAAYEKKLAKVNSQLRQVEQRKNGTIRLHLQMSEQDYEQLLLKYPVLHHGRREQRRKAWERVAKKRPDLAAMEFKPRLFPTK